MGNSASTSAKRQAARHAREERKREFEREQEHETRLALERDELLARIRALLDENNIFDPLTDDDRAALARQCRRCVALPGERVLQWRTKRERAVLRQARDAAEAERELERERAGHAPLRDEDYEFDPDTALYVVAEGAVEIIIHHDDDDDDDDDEEAKNTAVRRLKDSNSVVCTLRRGGCFGELERIFGMGADVRATVVAVDPNADQSPDDPTSSPKAAVMWAIDGRTLRRKRAFKAMVHAMAEQVAAWTPLLDGVPFFSECTTSTQRAFLACALRSTRFTPREAIAKENDECSGAWMVMEGEAHAMVPLVGGDEKWVAGYWPGDGFGFNSLTWGHELHEPCLTFEANMRCGEDPNGAELAYVGRETFRRMFAGSHDTWRLMRERAAESLRTVVEERDSKRPAPRRFGDPNVARMIAAMAASTADTAHDTHADVGGGGDASPRPRTPRTPSPRRGWHPPHPPLVLRQPTDTTQTGRHLPDELLYPEEFETESENEQENDENDDDEGNEGNETPRERRRLASRGRDSATDKKEDEERRRRRREGKPQTRDPDRPVRRRAPLGPNPHGPHRLERLRACLEAHSLFEGAEKSLLKKAAEDLELVVVPAGSALYKHGAKGDYLYVVEAGTLDVMAPNPSGVGTPRVTESVGAGAVVGDVALTFAAVREHTLRAGATGAKVWGMRRSWFERVAGHAVHGRRRLIRRFINDVPILRGLPVHEQYACAEGFREAVFRPGDVVARQGDFPDYFYILEEGTAKCTVHLPGESEQLPVAHYGRGSYFGELEFLGDVRKGARKAVGEGTDGGGLPREEWRLRKATVTATTAIRCAAIEGSRFAELVGEGTELRRRMVKEARTYVNSIH